MENLTESLIHNDEPLKQDMLNTSIVHIGESPIWPTNRRKPKGPIGMQVSVSALCLYIEDEREAYNRYVNGIRHVPNSSTVNGVLEHKARELAFPVLRKIYYNADSDIDLVDAPKIVGQAVEQATMMCHRKYGALLSNIDQMGGDICARLLVEENQRILSASNYLHDGVKGYDLVRQVLPLEVEMHLSNEYLGLYGAIDAVGVRGDVRYPIDYKTGKYSGIGARASHEFQVTAYAMLMESYYGVPCNYAEIRYTRYFQCVPVLITPEMKTRVKEVLVEFIEHCEGTHSFSTDEEVYYQ